MTASNAGLPVGRPPDAGFIAFESDTVFVVIGDGRIGIIGKGDVAASIRDNVARNLRRLMREADLRGIDLAKKIGYSQSRVSQWMNGKGFPEEKAFDALREQYGWTYEELVRDPSITIIDRKRPMSRAELLGLFEEITEKLGLTDEKLK